jgi:hypothetical protein
MSIGNPISLTSQVASKTISIIATASQTAFTVTGGYRINQLAVFRNGIRLVDSRDYEARDGATVTLLSAASEGDAVEFQVFDAFQVADTINPYSTYQTIDGNLNITGIITAATFSVTDLDVRNITAVAATFTGQVTYEDVTNVDSIGIATFRDNVNIGVGGTTAFFDVGTGNVGIGTDNPPAKLSVDGSVIFGNTTSSGSGGTLRVVESGNSVYIQPGSNTSNDSSCDLIVSSINGSTEKLRIDSDGRVRLNGVAGVATFSARLHTNGNFHLRPIKDVTGTTPADAGVCIDILSDDNGTVNDLAIRGATIIFRNDSSETLRILSGGQVNIGGNYTQTTYTMQVTGTINATSNITQNGNALATNGKAIAMALIFG